MNGTNLASAKGRVTRIYVHAGIGDFPGAAFYLSPVARAERTAYFYWNIKPLSNGLDYLTIKTKFMNTETVNANVAAPGLATEQDFLPIPLSTAVAQVQNFRNSVNKNFGYGVIFTADDTLNYLCHHYQRIVDRQPDPVAAGYEGYEWGIGHFFMRHLGNGELDYCIAPVLFKKDPFTGKTTVVDPFDPNCNFPYTYNQKLGKSDPGDDVDIFDMGEMWP